MYPLELLPPQSDFSGQKFFQEKFTPFQWTGRWKFATNGVISQHFYKRLNASKTARIKSKEDFKTHSVAGLSVLGFVTYKLLSPDCLLHFRVYVNNFRSSRVYIQFYISLSNVLWRRFLSPLLNNHDTRIEGYTS